jgi:signal transduction histidine kinase/CheY-like chemotaxis protein
VLYTVGIIKLQQDIASYAFFGVFSVLAAYVYRSRIMNFKSSALWDIFEAYNDSVLLIDMEGVISDYNGSFSRNFPDVTINENSTTVHSLVEYFTGRLVSGSDLEKLGAFAEGRISSGEMSLSADSPAASGADSPDDSGDSDAGEKTYTLTRQLVQSGKKPKGFIITIADVSKSRNMIRELIELKNTAESASRAKSAFLATMSHEIRTPLNAIIGLADIQLQKNTDEGARGDIKKIHNSGNDLLNIINDILDISKIEAGGFELIPVEYESARMIHNTVQVNRVRVGSKPIGFELELDENIPKKLYGDELRVKQILNNLLSNAIKYTAEGKVKLSLLWKDCEGENTGVLVCSVNDTGQGIRPEDQEKLFQEYAQLDTRANRKVEGTGLGLSITKKLLGMMNGDISVESEYGHGSVFTARLYQGICPGGRLGKDLADDLMAGRYWESAMAEDLVREYMPYGKVLIVDDVDINLEVAKGIMEPYGLQIDLAVSGQEAIDKIKNAAAKEALQYDLVFMDHMMPGMDGIEATKIIREDIDSVYAKNVPIIALTANAITGNEEMFLSNGFTGFISKPIDLRGLDQVLNQFVKK